MSKNPVFLAAVVLAALVAGAASATAQQRPARERPAAASGSSMVPMEQVGPQPRSYSDKAPRRVALRSYAHVIHVAPGEKHQTVADALASVEDASPTNRYAILVAAGTYSGSRLQMKQWVDLYGGYAPGDWQTRDVY